MTSLLTYTTQTSNLPSQLQPNSPQDEAKHNSYSENSVLTTDQADLSLHNDAYYSDKTRSDSIEIEDSITKKLKTHPSVISETCSSQFSPSRKTQHIHSYTILKQDIASEFDAISEETPSEAEQDIKPTLHIPEFIREKSKPFLIIRPNSISTQANSICSLSERPILPRSESVLSTLTLQTPTTSDADNSYAQLMRAIGKLRLRMLFLQENPVVEEIYPDVFFDAPIYEIPPFRTMEASLFEDKPAEKKNVKKSLGKMLDEDSEDPQVYYGSIEFPFLSLSAPIQELNNILKGQVPTTEKKPIFEIKRTNQPDMKPKKVKSVKLAKILSKTKGKNQNDANDSLTATREGTQRSENEEIDPSKNKSGKKKTVKALEEKSLNTKRKGSFSAIRSTKKEIISVKAEKKNSKEKLKEIEKSKKKAKENKDIKNKETKKEQEREKDKENNSRNKPKTTVKDEEDYYNTRTYNTGKAEREKRKTRRQLVLDGKISPLEETVNQAIVYLHDGGKKNSFITPVGKKHQVAVCSFENEKRNGRKRELKLKWNPENCTEEELTGFSKTIKSILRRDILQEKEIDFLTMNNNNLEKAVKYVKNNKIKIIKNLNEENSERMK